MLHLKSSNRWQSNTKWNAIPSKPSRIWQRPQTPNSIWMCDSRLNRLRHHLSRRTNSNTTMRAQLIQWDRNCVAFQTPGTRSTAAFAFVRESRKMRPKTNYSRRLWSDRHSWIQHTDWRDRPTQHKLGYQPCRCIWCAAAVFLWHSIAIDVAGRWTVRNVTR